MTSYVKSTNFASKDSLASGNPLKIVKGTEIDIEFNNIATAVDSKADTTSPTFSGIPLAPTAALGNNTTQLATTAFVLQHLYPVGSIYINAGVSTNPATLFGFGTWAAFGAGRVIVGLNGSDSLFDALEETGGSKDAIVVSHTHTYSGTTDGVGNHTHPINRYTATGPGQNGFGGGDNGVFAATNYTGDAGAHSHTFSGTAASTGSSGTNANLQPYITVAMWKRTA
jgi:hypothetical protein